MPSAINELADKITGIDWSQVSDELVSRAITRLLQPSRMEKRWSGLTPDTQELHHQILRAYMETGHPPKIATLNLTLIRDLEDRDFVVVGDGGIRAAYPFSTSPTAHLVEISGQEIAAVCAIDALGTAAMVASPVQVQSQCPVCDATIQVSVDATGLGLSDATHPDARVWAGVTPIGGCAADSQCQSMLVFCSSGHLLDWRSDQPQEGFDLSLSQAIELGAAIFAPFLKPLPAPPEQA